MPEPHFVQVLAEGPTERSVLNALLTRHLAPRNIHLVVESLDGAVSRERVVRNVVRMLKERPATTVTTFFDYYGTKGRWAELGLAQNQPIALLGERVEQALRDWITAELPQGSARPRFLPYVQMHELEALFFAQPEVLADAFAEPAKASDIRCVLSSGFTTCEEINNSPQTAPSKRIELIFGRYRKGAGLRSQARIFAETADLDAIRRSCPRFSTWVDRLERLPELPVA